MVYLFPSGDTFTIIHDVSILTEEQKAKAIRVEALPPGEGILKMDEQGGLYYEPMEPEVIEPTPTIEEEILFETKYQTMLLEMNTLL